MLFRAALVVLCLSLPILSWAADALKPSDAAAARACAVATARMAYPDPATQLLGIKALAGLTGTQHEKPLDILKATTELCRTGNKECRDHALLVFAALGRQPGLMDSPDVVVLLGDLMTGKLVFPQDQHVVNTPAQVSMNLAISFLETANPERIWRGLPESIQTELMTLKLSWFDLATQNLYRDAAYQQDMKKLGVLLEYAKKEGNGAAATTLRQLVEAHPKLVGVAYGIENAALIEAAAKDFDENMAPILAKGAEARTTTATFIGAYMVGTPGGIHAQQQAPIQRLLVRGQSGVATRSVEVLAKLIANVDARAGVRVAAAKRLKDITVADAEDSPALTAQLLKVVASLRTPIVPALEAVPTGYSEKKPVEDRNKEKTDQAAKDQKELGDLATELEQHWQFVPPVKK